jgi:hypothetical protein
MARTLYVAQTLPLPTTYERQLSATINWFVWHGSIFKVPLSTLHRRKQNGGWDLINIAAKCRALFYNGMRIQEHKGGTLTGAWLKHWGLHKRSSNPPKGNTLPTNLEYLRLIEIDSAYIRPMGNGESMKT